MPDATQQSRTEMQAASLAEDPDAGAAGADYVRIAHALLGVSPAQLASHLGGSSDPRQFLAATSPTRTLDDLSRALRAALEVRGLNSGEAVRATPALDAELGLKGLVQAYIALRSEWENREAQALAAHMRRKAYRDSTGRRASADAVAAGSRRALLVDDASEILITVGAFLVALGFEVVRASSGDLALPILAGETRFDLLVTDHAMPNMSGKELVLLARERFPRLRALVITGFPNAPDLGALPPGVALLAKPFRRAELAECVQRLFDTGEPGRGAQGLVGAS
ncbi:MAG: response regulator [Acetobacteraceae bacterium]|nr:response regulator [Acetobacteraceae bacterium]